MSEIFSVMTYNVHSSIGMDGKASPLRIAEVIDCLRPDIVALQELDAGLVRTAMIDQAHMIAMTLEMSYHFHSSIQVEEGEYGNAILSRYPVRLVKAGALPAEPVHSAFERRGAVWTEVEVGGRPVQIITTHFGLNWRERIMQAQALVGPEWLGHPECRAPVVVCGDFNTVPGTPAYFTIARKFRDAQRFRWRPPLGTWPVRCPVLRIDHLFTSPDLTVKRARVPTTPLTRMASDHLPLVVTLELS